MILGTSSSVSEELIPQVVATDIPVAIINEPVIIQETLGIESINLPEKIPSINLIKTSNKSTMENSMNPKIDKQQVATEQKLGESGPGWRHDVSKSSRFSKTTTTVTEDKNSSGKDFKKHNERKKSFDYPARGSHSPISVRHEKIRSNHSMITLRAVNVQEAERVRSRNNTNIISLQDHHQGIEK